MWGQVQDCGVWIQILDMRLTGDTRQVTEPFCASVSPSKGWREQNSSYLVVVGCVKIR